MYGTSRAKQGTKTSQICQTWCWHIINLLHLQEDLTNAYARKTMRNLVVYVWTEWKGWQCSGKLSRSAKEKNRFHFQEIEVLYGVFLCYWGFVCKAAIHSGLSTSKNNFNVEWNIFVHYYINAWSLVFSWGLNSDLHGWKHSKGPRRCKNILSTTLPDKGNLFRLV